MDEGPLDEITGSLIRLSQIDRLLVVTGGGRCANIIRMLDREEELGEIPSHLMAIMCMHLNAYKYSSLYPDDFVLTSDIYLESENRIPIILPLDLIDHSGLPASWEVTSDTISAYIAKLVGGKLVLVKDVDGLLDPYPGGELVKEISAGRLCTFQSTPVDPYLPRFLLDNALEAWLVNGLHPERLEMIIKNQMPVCTLITPGNGENQ